MIPMAPRIASTSVKRPPYYAANQPVTSISELLALLRFRPRPLQPSSTVHRSATAGHPDQHLHGLRRGTRRDQWQDGI